MITTVKLVPKTWTNISNGESIDFQVLYGESVYWKYSTTTPTGVPYVDENAFYANVKQMYTSTSQNGDVWVFTSDPDGAFISTGESATYDVISQNKDTKLVIAKFNEVSNSTTLSAPAVRNAYAITVTDTTGFVDGRYIIMFDVISETFGFATQIGAPVGNVITLDTPLAFPYPAGTNVDTAITDMSVDGSITPRVFGLRGTGAPPGVDIEVDITRIIFTCLADSAVSLPAFGNIPALTRGLVLRKRNGEYENIFNVKSNIELASIQYDFAAYVATNPAQDLDGFVASLTFTGNEKIGATVRLPVGDDLEFIVQDDLTDLVSFAVVAEGHVLVK